MLVTERATSHVAGHEDASQVSDAEKYFGFNIRGKFISCKERCTSYKKVVHDLDTKGAKELGEHFRNTIQSVIEVDGLFTATNSTNINELANIFLTTMKEEVSLEDRIAFFTAWQPNATADDAIKFIEHVNCSIGDKIVFLNEWGKTRSPAFIANQWVLYAGIADLSKWNQEANPDVVVQVLRQWSQSATISDVAKFFVSWKPNANARQAGEFLKLWKPGANTNDAVDFIKNWKAGSTNAADAGEFLCGWKVTASASDAGLFLKAWKSDASAVEGATFFNGWQSNVTAKDLGEFYVSWSPAHDTVRFAIDLIKSWKPNAGDVDIVAFIQVVNVDTHMAASFFKTWKQISAGVSSDDKTWRPSATEAGLFFKLWKPGATNDDAATFFTTLRYTVKSPDSQEVIYHPKRFGEFTKAWKMSDDFNNVLELYTIIFSDPTTLKLGFEASRAILFCIGAGILSTQLNADTKAQIRKNIKRKFEVNEEWHKSDLGIHKEYHKFFTEDLLEKLN